MNITNNVGIWSLMGRLTRLGETTRDFDFGGGFPDPQTYDEEWVFDFEVAADVTDKWTVVGAANLFDKYPDESNGDINFFGHLPYDVLSPVGMNGRYYFARMQFNFD